MKRMIRASKEITPQVLREVEDQIKLLRGSSIDRDNHIVTVVFPKGFSEDEAMEDGMLGSWFKDKGFNVSFSQGDYEYTTQDTWRNARGWNREKGHKAYLRDRLIMTATW